MSRPPPLHPNDTYTAGYRDGERSKLDEIMRLRARIAELERNYEKTCNQLARMLASTGAL